MNKKGFTLVELLATLVILAIVMGIVLASGIFNLENAKGKTEDVFIDSIKDAMKIYLERNYHTMKKFVLLIRLIN